MTMEFTHKDDKVKVGFADFQNEALSLVQKERDDMLDIYKDAFDAAQYENQLSSSPSKESYRFGEYDNQVLHRADKPQGFDVHMTEFGSYMHEVFEVAVKESIDNYYTAKSKLDDDKVIDLSDIEETYAVTLFKRFLTIIDFDANYLTEKVVRGHFMNILFEGSADLIEIHSDNSFTVIDYKNYSKLTEQDIQGHLTQCRIYASCYAKQTGMRVREIKVHYPMQDMLETETYSG
jgi:hypothetical protein